MKNKQTSKGRPSKGELVRKVVSFTLLPETIKRLEDFCKLKDRSKSLVIEQALEAFFISDMPKKKIPVVEPSESLTEQTVPIPKNEVPLQFAVPEIARLQSSNNSPTLQSVQTQLNVPVARQGIFYS